MISGGIDESTASIYCSSVYLNLSIFVLLIVSYLRTVLLRKLINQGIGNDGYTEKDFVASNDNFLSKGVFP